MAVNDQTFTARMLADIARKAWGPLVPPTFDDKSVRSIARDERKPDGSPLLPRFATRGPDGSNRSHQYTFAEAKVILTFYAGRIRSRTGRDDIRVPAPFGEGRATDTATRSRTGQRAVRTKPAPAVQPEGTVQS